MTKTVPAWINQMRTEYLNQFLTEQMSSEELKKAKTTRRITPPDTNLFELSTLDKRGDVPGFMVQRFAQSMWEIFSDSVDELRAKSFNRDFLYSGPFFIFFLIFT